MNQQNELSFIKRFWIYQKERFPFFAHGILIAAFTFSAIAYSILSREEDEFIPLTDYGICVAVNLLFFFLVRIFDEFKDKEDDAKYRKELPVPRGLISLKELKIVGIIAFVLQAILVFTFQKQLLMLYGIVWVYLVLMRYEFFAPEYLKSKQALYVLSHMLLIPFIDMYASAAHWYHLPEFDYGIAWFLAVSYVNGMVLEFGRKLKVPGDEKIGVVTYTALYGIKGGTGIWMAVLMITFALSLSASYFVNHHWLVYVILSLGCLIGIILGLSFIKSPTKKISKALEVYSGLWSIGMYLCLGLGPFISK